MSDQNTEQKWATLVGRLSKQTADRKLTWKTSPDENTIRVKIGNNHISITRSRNRDSPDDHDFFVEIFRSDGRVVDVFSDEMVAGSYPKLTELYTAAFRQANGSDDVLDEILDALPDDDENPF